MISCYHMIRSSLYTFYYVLRSLQKVQSVVSTALVKNSLTWSYQPLYIYGQKTHLMAEWTR